ncbi:hypothetical protein LOC67_24125 [Stieleria sp. JC731]|uniref:hypothetical protein n=1 Tax=Pirellulaceae TaxID=2691357 RepID=UPI001E2CD09E|nr:hypothetical protein [Stieleria sp. JC731]MCC9603648.1 hypothetical protein [Stieleria sp. JC731]
MKPRISGIQIAGVAFVVGVILATVSPLLSGKRIAFRDSSHFYLPLYEYVAKRTQHEWMPLWNPLDQTGIPLIGESSTAVLYPVRHLAYSLPISPEAALNAYLIFHLLLASAGAGWLARRWSMTSLGVAAASLVYPLSGSVLGLMSNPPFLVGAAYLPWALSWLLGPAPCSQMQKRKRTAAWLRSICFGGASLAMMVLGGDPQTALHVVLVCGFLSFVQSFKKQCRKTISDDANSQAITKQSKGGYWQRLFRQQTQLVSACCLAALIAAPQIAASWHWSRQSDRASSATERVDLYDFSVPPWHLAELISPRPFGHPFPINLRISKLIPGDGRMWTPSLYAGFIVGFALICRLLFRRSEATDPFAMLAVIAMLLSFGHFGLVWLLQQLPGTLQDTNSAAGGLYWALCQIVPGYESFRYPAKWLPVFAIAASMVTGRWLSTFQMSHFRIKRERSLLLALAGLLLVSVGAIQFASWYWTQQALAHKVPVPRDEYWGPLNIALAIQLIRTSLLWSLLMLLGVLWLTKPKSATSQSGSSRARPYFVSAAWLTLIAVDCAFSGYNLIPMVSIERERQVANQITPPKVPSTRALRTQKDNDAGVWPEGWRGSDSPNRALQVAASERVAWFGRWHLADNQAVLNSMVSIKSKHWSDFWKEANEVLPALTASERDRFWRSLQQWLAVDAISQVDGRKSMAADGLAYVFVTRRKINSQPMARLATNWQQATTMNALVHDLALGDVTTVPRLNDPAPEPEKRSAGNGQLQGGNVNSQSDGEPDRPKDCQLTQINNHHFRVTNDVTCLLVRSIFQDGNWTATIRSLGGSEAEDRGEERFVEVLQSSFLNQAVQVPPGDWEVEFTYRPFWKGPSLVASCLGVAIFSIGMLSSVAISRSAKKMSP